jgi:hypothetical protein
MKFQDHKRPAGSFGIPEEIKEAAHRQQARNTKSESSEEQTDYKEAAEASAKSAVESDEEDEERSDSSPEAILEKLGAKFTEDDFSQLIFKGTYEATIPVVKGRLTGKFRTLTSDEYDQIDEILAKEMKDVDMTQDGLRTRSSMWVISYGVTELNNKLVAKPIKDKEGKVDLKATAIERRKVFANMAPAIVNQLIQKHGAITVAINTIAAEPSENLKNS